MRCLVTQKRPSLDQALIVNQTSMEPTYLQPDGGSKWAHTNSLSEQASSPSILNSVSSGSVIWACVLRLLSSAMTPSPALPQHPCNRPRSQSYISRPFKDTPRRHLRYKRHSPCPTESPSTPPRCVLCIHAPRRGSQVPFDRSAPSRRGSAINHPPHDDRILT